jgi:hypothetical protein
MGGKILTYDMEGDPSRRFLRVRSKAIEDHLVFDGDEHEGEFCKRFPNTCMEIRGLYSIDQGVLSVYVTQVPEGQTIEGLEDLFEQLMDGSR